MKFRQVTLLSVLAALTLALLILQRRPTPLPDVVILVIDAARADRLGCYGGPQPTSPHIDGLAAEGVLFEDTCCSAPRTWQSFSSILTGLYPLHHGVRYLWDDPLPKEIPTLASVLLAAGYEAVAFDTIAYIRGMTGGRAFEYYVDADLRGKPLEDATLLDTVLEWLSQESEQPRFAFVRLHGPHWPYAADERSLRAMGEARFQHLDHDFLVSTTGGLVPLESGQGFAIADAGAYRELFYDLDEARNQHEHRILHYDAALRTTDEHIGRLVDGLRRRGQLDSTLLVITSDHGESFGEHGYLQHGPRVDQTVMAVPLIMRFPKAHFHGRAGQKVAKLVRSVDIMPTILETLGLGVPPDLDGRSLVSVVDTDSDLQLTCYGESGRAFPGVDPAVALPGIAGKERMLRDHRFKLVYRHDGRAPRYRLFDLEADPGESRDVSTAFPADLARLREELEALIATDVNPDEVEAPISEEQREQLRALGYVR